MDFSRMRNIEMTGNSYHGISKSVSNSVQVEHTKASLPDLVWILAGRFPFGGSTEQSGRSADGQHHKWMGRSARRSNGSAAYSAPYVLDRSGNGAVICLQSGWSTAFQGSSYAGADGLKR